MRKSFKLLLGLLLAVLMVASVMTVGVFAEDEGTALAPLQGSGTEADPYQINDLDDLVNFSKLVNAGSTFAGEYVELTADIDLTGVVWTPIGTSNYDKTPDTEGVKVFAGNFDGGNHTITGLSSNGYVPAASETGSTEYSFGLFGYVYGANISNVKLANVDINGGTRTDSEGNKVYGSGVAALVGYYVPADETTAVIENCHVLGGTVKASNNMGGLIGHMDSQLSQPKVDITIENCSNAADVTTEAREAGGILGLMNSAREGNYYVTMSGTVTFKDCVNTGAITSLGGGAPSAGGILGRDHNQASGQRLKIVFDGCENSGTITVTANGETHAAGIGAGYYSAGAWLIAKDCVNTGDVIVSGNGDVYAGGLISYGGVVELIDSTSTGSVTVDGVAGNTYVGGAQNILFLEGMDDFNDTVNGYVYQLNGGVSPEYAALVDDAAGGGNFHLVETAYKKYSEFVGWYDNPEFNGDAYTKLSKNVKTYYAKWNVVTVATIGDVEYATLQDAINAATGKDLIVLVNDTTETVTIPAKATVGLDLNGKTLYGSILAPEASLMIRNGTIINTDASVSAIEINAGKMDLINMNIESARHAVRIDGSVEATIDGGKYTVNGTSGTRHAVNASKGANVVIKDGTFVGPAGTTMDSGSAVCVQANTTVTIEGGSFSKGKNHTLGVSGTMIITGGTFDQDPTAYLAKSYLVKKNANGQYDVVKGVAKIGDTYYASLADAIAAIGSGDVVIDLIANATFDYNARDAYGLADTNSITINGNGYTLTLNQKNSDWASLGMANANGKLVINNATIEKTGYGDTNGAWNTHAIIFSCNVEMTDVTVNNGIAVQNGATLNNVTINEANAYYGLWINGNGQTVTVNGGEINATNGGRGIKIADQYIDAPKSVILNVTGTEFNTAKKAAVLVSSKAGAVITADGVDITKVAEDDVNFVWVDEDWAAYFGEVTVNGCTVAQEAAEDFEAALVKNGKIQSYYKTLAEAIKAAEAGDTVTVFAGTYAVPSLKAGITIEGVGDVLFEGTLSGTLENLTLKNIHIKGANAQRWGYAKGDLVFENVTFEATSVYALHFDGIKEGTTLLFKDCTIIGWAAMGGTPASCVFEGCTIKGNGSYGVIRTYFDATIVNCTFDVDNVNTGDVYQDGIHAVGGATVTVNNCTNVNGAMSDLVNVSGSSVIIVDGVKYQNAAKIGDTYYATVADAFAAAKDGDEVVILVAGNYAVPTGKNITVAGAVEGVTFGTIGAVNMGGASVTFNNVTFNYAITSTYKGLQHSGNLVYNSCTFNGQVFLYGESETFNNCTFNQTSANAYNVWTYGGKTVEFNECTFNSVGKSVLIYSESKSLYNDVTFTDCVFAASAPVDGKAAIEMDSSLTAGINLTINNATVTGMGIGNVSGNSLWNNKKGSNTDANNDITVTVDGKVVLAPVTFVAKIGDTGYTSLADAFAAAKDGDEVVILVAGTYNVPTKKNITITGAVDGVAFDMKNAVGVYASMTFNNVTFEYGNANYKGLQHAGTMIYNNCTINGQVFLYGESETFNKCTFNQTSANAYNVWTYGGKTVEFNECTFNSVGKSVLIYSEDKNLVNDVTFTDCVFAASAPVDGKAAIEMDSSLTAGINLTINNATVTGMGIGNVSGNSLWNNKKGSNTDANNDITVVVDGKTVLAPVKFVAKIGTIGYTSIADAIKAANAGETVTILAGSYTTDVTVNKAITVVGETDADGNNLVNVTGKLNITADGATVKYLNINNGSGNGGYINAKDVLVEGCTVVGGNGFRNCYTTGTVTFKDSTITGSTYGIHFDGSAGGNIVIDNCVITGWTSFARTITKVTISDTTFAEGNYNYLRFYQNEVVIDGCTFNEKMTIDIAVNGATVTVTDSAMSDGSDVLNAFNKDDLCGQNDVTINGDKIAYVAKIGNTYYATLEEALADVASWTSIKLVGNATLDYNAREAYGRLDTEEIIIDGQGKYTLTLNQKDSDWSSIGMLNPEGKLTLKNMTIEKTGYGDTSGAWNTHAINFTCNVELNNVTVNNGIAVQNGATLNNVTINEAGGYYGLWIEGNGQTVEVNGGEINATNGGRGIKIADQYVGTPASVTLTVDGMKFNTAKKAAVLVSSKAGADITAANVDITEVVADPVNFVWVDEDWAAYYGEVTVTGCTLAQEAIETFVASLTKDGAVVGYYKTLQAAINACSVGDNTIQLLNKYNTPITEDVTIKQTEGVNITIDGDLLAGGVHYRRRYSGTITIHGNARYTGAETLTIKNIEFKTSEANHYFIDSNSTGSVERYAHNVTVSNCYFKAEGDAKHTAVAMRIRQGFNISIVSSNPQKVTAQDLHSLFQGYGCTGVTIDQVRLNNMKNGVSLGTSTGVVINNVVISAEGYGIRADGTGAYDMTVTDATITANDPIVIRKTSGAYALTLEGTNKLTANNEKGYQVTFTGGDDGTYEAPSGQFTLTGGETLKVYPLTCVTVTLDDVTVVAGNKFEFTYTLSNPALADKITVTFNEINASVAGTYAITATVVAPENYEVTVIDGTLTVQTAVVKVKANDITTFYASFDEAWEAAPGASTGGVSFTLLASVTLDRTYVYNDDRGYVEFVSSNWKKFTITGTTSDPLFKIESGTPKFKNIQIDAYGDAFYVTGGSLSIMSVGNNSQNTIVTSQTGNVVYTRGGSTTILGGPTLTAYGEYPAIQGNGMYAGNVTIQKWSYEFQSKISAPNSDMAIYWPQNGTLNISFGEITGKTAVWAKSGNIVISGGTFIATGDKVAYAPYNNGANATGDALVIEASANAAYELPVVSITGGTFQSANGEAVAYYTEGESKLADEQFITGGIFSSDVSDICEIGYGAEPQADGTYVVKPMIVINIDDKTMVEGNELPEFTYTVESFGRDVTATLQTAFTDTDGKTVGTFTINGTPVAVEGYYVKVEPATLTVVERVVSVDGVGFTSLKDAIASIQKGQGEATVVLHQDITVKGQFIGHSYAQKVVLDLNGHKISSTDKALTVYRAGTTVLIKNGTVYGNTTGGTIQVTYGGQLTLENVTITCGGSANALKVDANSTLIIADENVKVLGGKNDLIVADNATVEISAGLFKHEVKAAWCARGYYPVAVEGGYSVALGACVIGDTVYTTLTDAIAAAQDGDTIVLMSDISVKYADAVDAKDGFKSFFVVAGKSIAIDLNGKTIYGDATSDYVMVNGQSAPEGLLLGMFTTIENGHLTLEDSSNGKGTVQLKAGTGLLDDNGKTYSYYAYGLLVNYDDDCSIVAKGGRYIADDVYDALVYTSCDTVVDAYGEIVTGVIVDDGYFFLTNVGKGSRGNGSPWIFNARGQQIRSVVVNGGTFNANVNAQYWVFEVEIDKTLALKDNGDGTWTVVEAAAYVNKQHWASAWYTRETGYATFEEAIAACEEVKTKTVGKKVYTSEAEGVTLLRDIILDGSITIG